MLQLFLNDSLALICIDAKFIPILLKFVIIIKKWITSKRVGAFIRIEGTCEFQIFGNHPAVRPVVSKF
jgi:hypothetical protein